LIVPEALKETIKRFTTGESIIIEPVRKNTAPAIGLAAMELEKRYGEGIMHIMPADHLIADKDKFILHLRFGEDIARKDYLVTYGIKPTRPETGYGYIRVGNEIAHRNNIFAYKAEGFTEKPNLVRAKSYLKKGNYLWNSGIFTFKISSILREIKRCIPETYNQLRRYFKNRNKKDFARIKETSIDYGVMEKSGNLCVVKAEFSWDDVGSWLALERYFKKDKQGNVFSGDALGLDTMNSIVYAYNVPVRVYGIKGLVVVASPRGVLVCKKERAPDLKKLLRAKR